MSLEDKFHSAAKLIRSLPIDGPYKPSNNTKLKFYSLFKQATEGPCKESKPGFWDIVGRAKWESWTRLGDMSSEKAMITYIDEFKKITSTMSYDIHRDFLDPKEIQELSSSGRSQFANSTTQQAVQRRRMYLGEKIM